jgi:ACT domain-containing protein
MDFEVEVPDAPGELSRVLQVVARFGGNVLSVVHRHEAASPTGVPVVLAVEIPEPAALKLADALARTHRILRLGREGGPVRAAVLVVGHVFEAGLTPLLDAVFETGTEVAEVDARIAGRANPSAVLIGLTATDAHALEQGLAAMRQRAAQDRLLLIEQAWGGPDG